MIDLIGKYLKMQNDKIEISYRNIPESLFKNNKTENSVYQ